MGEYLVVVGKMPATAIRKKASTHECSQLESKSERQPPPGKRTGLVQDAFLSADTIADCKLGHTESCAGGRNRVAEWSPPPPPLSSSSSLSLSSMQIEMSLLINNKSLFFLLSSLLKRSISQTELKCSEWRKEGEKGAAFELFLPSSPIAVAFEWHHITDTVAVCLFTADV